MKILNLNVLLENMGLHQKKNRVTKKHLEGYIQLDQFILEKIEYLNY